MAVSNIQLGPFRLTHKLGRGGMAEVWGGVHAEHGVPVAVKVVTGSGDRPPMQTHLRNEVRAMAQLDHPNIVVVFDYGEVSESEQEDAQGLLPAGSPYFAMDLAEGGTARTRCGRIPFAQVRHILLSLLDALAHAHARGVLHCDVKPSNILLLDETKVKLSDFGLAHRMDRERIGGRDRVSGTPAYMAPEQFDGNWRIYDCCTDLYAVGCVAHTLVCGKPPYGSLRDLGLMARLHKHGVLPPLAATIALPSGFEAWLLRLLSKNIANRYQRAADVAKALLALGEPRERDAVSVPAEGAMQPLYTLSEVATIPAAEAPASTSPPLERPARDSFISVWPKPQVTASWQHPDQQPRSMELLCAGLGLYGLRAIPLFAREPERDALWSSLKKVANEFEPRMVLLEGPAGCGKSHLAQWLCGRAHEMGAAFVLKAVHSPRAGPAHGLAPMIGRYLRAHGLPRGALRAHVTAMSARLGIDEETEVDALVELIAPASDAARSATQHIPRFASAHEKHVLLERLVQRLTLRRLVIIWLDDVQWGLETLAFVKHMMASAGTRVLLLLTARSESLLQRKAEGALLDSCLAKPRASRLTVGPLPDGQRVGLVQSLLRLDSKLAATIAHHTEGNPMYGVQLIGDWIERGLLEADVGGFRLETPRQLHLPADLNEIWDARAERFLAHRSAADATALELAATLGQEVDGAEWLAVCSFAGVRASPELVEDLITRRLASTDWRGPKLGWAFAHGTFRESIERRSQAAGRQPALHRLCAQMLSERPSVDATTRQGRHLLAAGDPIDALDPLRRAAREHIDSGNYPDADELLAERAGALTTLELDETDPRHSESWLLSCRLAIKRGSFDEAIKHARQAERVARARERSETLVEALVLGGDIQRMRGHNKQAEKLLREASNRARATGAHALLADGQQLLGRMLMHTGRLAEANVCWREARTLFETLGDRAGAATTVWQMGHAASYVGRYDEAVEYNEHALTELERCGDRWGVARCLNQRGENARLRGKLDHAERAYRDAAIVFEAIGANDALAICECNVARVLVERERHREAREQLERGAADFEASGRNNPLAWVQTVLLCCLAAQGEWVAWDRRLKSVTALLSASGYVDLDIARSAQMAGDRALAAGQPRRARAAYSIALSQSDALARKELSEQLAASIAEIDRNL